VILSPFLLTGYPSKRETHELGAGITLLCKRRQKSRRLSRKQGEAIIGRDEVSTAQLFEDSSEFLISGVADNHYQAMSPGDADGAFPNFFALFSYPWFNAAPSVGSELKGRKTIFWNSPISLLVAFLVVRRRCSIHDLLRIRWCSCHGLCVEE
jgi:hypothetical protein